jgi:hypothetical protein
VLRHAIARTSRQQTAKVAVQFAQEMPVNADDADQRRIARIKQAKGFFLFYPLWLLCHPRNPRSPLFPQDRNAFERG